MKSKKDRRFFKKPKFNSILLIVTIFSLSFYSAIIAAELDEKKILPMPSENNESLLAQWQNFKTMPVLNYSWSQDIFQELRDIGITGIYKKDRLPPAGGQKFLAAGLHGFMLQAHFINDKEKVIGYDGKPVRPGKTHSWCSSIFSQKNKSKYYAYVARELKNYGINNLFTVGNTIVVSSWDETGKRSRSMLEYGYDAREEFIRYLKTVIFKSDSPAGKPGDAWTFNRATQLDLASWDEVYLPALESRYENPGLWRLWMDFHAYYTIYFFYNAGKQTSNALNRDVELYTNLDGDFKWPGIASQQGEDMYWQARIQRIICALTSRADGPGSELAHAFTDQLSRRYQRPVIGLSQFYPNANRDNDPKKISRALAKMMGHNIHGFIFWVYGQEWNEKPEARNALGYWHKLFNIHWPFLAKAWSPSPQVAVVYPRNTANMYPHWTYPKKDFGWLVQALKESHIHFEIIADNQVEESPEILGDYKVLLIPGATWEGKRFYSAVEKFVNSGGFVYTDGDSLSMNMETGQREQLLERVFKVRFDEKNKGLIQPTFDSIGEFEWREGHAKAWQKVNWLPFDLDKGQKPSEIIPVNMENEEFQELAHTCPTRSGTGIKQRLLDPRIKHFVAAVGETKNLPATHRTFHDIVTASVLKGGNVVANYNGKACAIETGQTLWTGFRAGFDHAMRFPIKSMGENGESIWPFEKDLSTNAAGRRSSSQWLTRIIEKAGIKPLVEISLNGEISSNVQATVRSDEKGNSFIILTNHEEHSGDYQLTSNLFSAAESVANLMAGNYLAVTGNSVTLYISGGESLILSAGSKQFTKERLDAQQTMEG